MKPLISIILPVYNGENYIKQSLNNILNQTFTNYELIVINDGSTDNTENICEKICQTNDKIKLISKKNEGPSVARNIGIEKAHGEWICFIDSDDSIKNTYLENLAEFINSADLIITTFLYGNKHIDILPNHYELPCTYQLAQIYNEIHINYLGYLFGKLFKREILIKYGIRFSNHIKIAEDSIFMSQYFFHTNTIHIGNCDGYLYKIDTQNSLSKIANIDKRILSYKYNYKLRLKLVSRLNIPNTIIKLYYINSISYATKCIYANKTLPHYAIRKKYIIRLRNDDSFNYLHLSNSLYNKVSYGLLRYRFYNLFDLFNLVIRLKKVWKK